MSSTRARRFEGQVAIVTGGTTGIGLAAAKAFWGEGARVLIAARRQAEGEQALAAIGAPADDVRFVSTDVTDGPSVERMVDACMRAFGRLDVAFNNAGLTGPLGLKVHEADDAMFDTIMDVNVRGVWLSMKHQIPAMLTGGGGVIVNCGSAAGLMGGALSAAYSASKHAVIGLTRSAAQQYAADNIRVNAVCPGLVLTELVAAGFERAPERLPIMEAGIPMRRRHAGSRRCGPVAGVFGKQLRHRRGRARRRWPDHLSPQGDAFTRWARDRYMAEVERARRLAGAVRSANGT